MLHFTQVGTVIHRAGLRYQPQHKETEKNIDYEMEHREAEMEQFRFCAKHYDMDQSV